MPVKSCQRDGKKGYKWGDEGKCYTYTPGDEESRERAKDKAIEQGRAIQANNSEIKEDYCLPFGLKLNDLSEGELFLLDYVNRKYSEDTITEEDIPSGNRITFPSEDEPGEEERKKIK
jgi:hypothetical protein